MRKLVILLFCSVLSLPCTTFATEKLVFAVDLIRHGDRTPIKTIPNSSHKWKQGLGQLTAKGMRQEFNLGVKFRRKYIDNYHLLPETYQAGTMYVRSTDIQRTLMSAQSVLMGLYPLGTGPMQQDNAQPGLPNSFQPIPIHTAPTYMDDFIIHRVSAEEESRLFKKYVSSTKEWHAKENALQPYYARWSQLTGTIIRNLTDLELLADAFVVHKAHHVPLPTGITEEDADMIMQSGGWVFMQSERPKPIGHAHSHQLLSKIISYLSKAAEGKGKLKYLLLSAHDSTIATTLSALGAPLTTPPPYSSDLNFMLFENGPNNFYVKISYNDELVSLPGCEETYCSLDKFINLIEHKDV